MLPLGLFFYPLVLGAAGDLTFDGYAIDSQTDSLPRFLSTERLSDDWNVLELDKRRVDKSLFDNIASIKFLNPADNFLVVLAQSVLSNVKNLDLPSRSGNGTAENSTATDVDVGKLDLPSQIDDETAENSTATDAEVCKVELPEVTDNPVESLTVGKFNRSDEPVDSSIECLEKMYRNLLDYQFRRVNLRRFENEELR